MKKLTTFFCAIGFTFTAWSQGTLQNPGFENATIVPNGPSGAVQFGPAFPGWTGYFSGTPVTTALYNARPIDASGILVLDAGSGELWVPFAGTYTAALQGGTRSFDPSPSLAQISTIPVGTMSLRFYGRSSRENFIVSLDSQPLPISVVQDFGNYREYGVNIPSWAGQEAELRFTQPAGPGQFGIFYFDQISFSPVAVPEPGTWALLGLGSALFWCAARRRRK